MSNSSGGVERKLTKATSLPVLLTTSLSSSAGAASSMNKKKSTDLKASSGDNSVTVCVRIRPPNPKEIEANMKSCFNPTDEGDAVVEYHDDMISPKTWPYDFVFGAECSNEFVFNATARKLVSSALEGYNTVLFMYGQTSSGKTFTLFGGEGVAGLVDHTLREVYDLVINSTDTEYVVKMTFVELYNEELKDLLSLDPNQQEKLSIIEDPDLGPLIQGITEMNFTTVERMREHLNDGDRRRHFGVTNMNAHSSRSHVMVRFNIESRKVTSKPSNPLRQSWGKDKPTCFSTLNLVDLAGSERANKSGTSGQSLKEGSFINKSLLTLGTVIANLSEGKLKHVPYRDSKLTRLLASALGGNAKTCVITCISPAEGNISESISTLRFAQRAKNIVNHVKKNEIDDTKSLTQKLAMKQAEIDSLRADLESGNGGNSMILKDKALTAQRRYRILKFLMLNLSTITKSLTKVGKHELVKRVKDDIRAALEGSKSLEDILEDHSDILSNHLSDKQTLLRRMSYLHRINSMDSIHGQEGVDGENENDEEGLHLFEYNESDIFDNGLFTTSHDELIENNENLLMRIEDMTIKYQRIINKLLQETSNYVINEKKFKQSHDDLMKKFNSINEENKRVKEELNENKKKYDKLNKQQNEFQTSQSTEIDNMKQQLSSLEGILEEKETTLRNKIVEINNKEEDNEMMRKKIDQLQKDLHAANSMRDNFEKESKRTKEELNKQMERLRSNMSSMLQQGDQESKVLELQNSLLFNDLKLAQTECEALKFTQSQTEEHLNHLRKELEITQEDTRTALMESKELRQNVTKAQQLTQSLQLELTKVKAQNNVYEIDNERLKNNSTEEIRSLQNEIEKLNEMMKSDSIKYKGIINELNQELTKAKSSASHFQSFAESKESALIKIEQNGHFEALKLEKKLAEQMKLHEDSSHENAMIQKRLREKLSFVLDELNLYKKKVIEQEIHLENMNNLIQGAGYDLNYDDNDNDKNENENEDNDGGDSYDEDNQHYDSYDNEEDEDVDEEEKHHDNYDHNEDEDYEDELPSPSRAPPPPPHGENYIPFTPPQNHKSSSSIRKVFKHVRDDGLPPSDYDEDDSYSYSEKISSTTASSSNQLKKNTYLTPSTPPQHTSSSSSSSANSMTSISTTLLSIQNIVKNIISTNQTKYSLLKNSLFQINFIQNYLLTNSSSFLQFQFLTFQKLFQKYFNLKKISIKNSCLLNSSHEVKEYYEKLIDEYYAKDYNYWNEREGYQNKLILTSNEITNLLTQESHLQMRFTETKESLLNYEIKYSKLQSEMNEMMRELNEMRGMREEMERELNERVEENIEIMNERDLLEQENEIIRSERDELIRQFIPGGYYERDEYGVETLCIK